MRKKRTAKTRKTPMSARTVKGKGHSALEATSSIQPGVLPVVMAIASSVSGVKVSISKSGRPIKADAGLMGTDIAFETTPSDLIKLKLNDPRVGIKSSADIEVFRSNLAHLLPHAAKGLATIPLRPTSLISEAVGLVGSLLAKAPRLGAAPTAFTLGPLQEARKRLENKWGKVFASKSSPALVRQLTAATREAFVAGPAFAPALILEFSEQTPNTIPEPLSRSRTQRLASMRDAFYRLVSPVRVEIERTSGMSSVQVCWLNSTMRVAGQVKAVSGVADHKDLQSLDVARILRREMNVAGVTVHAPATRTRTGMTGKGVRVAVIDGEVDVAHPALAGRVALQENFTSEAFGTPDGHGTAVAGIIAAQDPTFSGIAPDALILNYKVFTTGDSTGDEFQGILAVEHALRDGIDIANCSWGIGPAGDGTDRNAKAFNRAWEQGLILIKSAGNEGPDNNTLTSPADADGVVVVGATEREGTTVQEYSSRGPTANGKNPHLVAPGGTQAANMETCLAAGGFGAASFGTSYATPIVSGAAALLRQQSPTAQPDQIRTRLGAMCRALAIGNVNSAGAGLLDLGLF
jgi:serine protease AprX